MAFINIGFHNIQSRQAIYAAGPGVYPTLPVNVCQGPNGSSGFGGPAPASNGWGANVTGVPANLSGLFVCEGPIYDNYVGWMPPPLLAGHLLAGLHPYNALNKLCAFFEGAPAVVAPNLPPAAAGHPLQAGGTTWFGNNVGSRVRCLGTGAIAPVGAAPAGSDRYGILFMSDYRYPLGGPQVTGLFVHTKNTHADPGTQITALCRQYPNEIIFGDMNLDLRTNLKRESLQASVINTHSVLSILQSGTGQAYYTRYNAGGAGTSTLDYALVPNARVPHVELWAHRPAVVARLSRHGSDHSAMLLKIRCS